jgi:Subtilase family
MNEEREFARMLCFTLILLTILGLAAACAPTMPGSQEIRVTAVVAEQVLETVVPELPTAVPTEPVTLPAGCCPTLQDRNKSYEDNQVILTGPPSEVATAINTTLQNYTLKKIGLSDLYSAVPGLEIREEGLDLGGLYDPTCAAWRDPDLQRVFSNPTSSESVTAYLYEVANAAAGDVEEVVQTMNGPANQLHVLADPNLTIGPDGEDACIVGSPHTLGGSPWTQPSCGQQGPTGSDFSTQWALTGIGAGGGGGSGVQVAIFDTWPSGAPANPEFEAPPYDFRAFPKPIVDPACLAPSAANHLADHGLAVASLVKAVAPDASISVYRVLNEDIYGRVLDLDIALAHYLNTAQMPAMINLSLGVRPLVDQAGNPIPTSVVVLKALLAAAYCRDIPVVAAAGNHGTQSPTAPQAPAAWSGFVIAAAASSNNGEKACFSNPAGPLVDRNDVGLVPQIGNVPAAVREPQPGGQLAGSGVMAPGGDGVDPSCQSDLDNCSGNCKSGVIGLVSANWCGAGYAYWAGTSFAAPLVSGLAARCLGVHPASSLTWQQSGPVVGVWTAIRDGAGGVGNIISVPSTESLCQQ